MILNKRLTLTLLSLSLIILSCQGILSVKLDKAAMLAHQGNYKDALSIYSEIALADRDGKYFSKAMHQSGDIYTYFLQDNDRALISYTQLLRYSRDKEEQLYALRQIAWLYQNRLKDPGRAIIAYNKILERFGKKKDISLHRIDIGDCYKEIGDFEQAIVEYRQFIDSLSTRERKGELAARAYFEMANCYYFIDQYPEAMENYQMVSKNYPDTKYAIRSLFWEAVCLENMKLYDQAIAAYQAIEDTYPDPKIIQTKIERIRNEMKGK